MTVAFPADVPVATRSAVRKARPNSAPIREVRVEADALAFEVPCCEERVRTASLPDFSERSHFGFEVIPNASRSGQPSSAGPLSASSLPPAPAKPYATGRTRAILDLALLGLPRKEHFYDALSRLRASPGRESHPAAGNKRSVNRTFRLEEGPARRREPPKRRQATPFTEPFVSGRARFPPRHYSRTRCRLQGEKLAAHWEGQR